MKPHLVFVYGTLKHGYSNNSLLRTSIFLGHAITRQRYLLVNRGFPIAFHGDGSFFMVKLPVLGEAYLCDDAALAHMDVLEGVRSGHYQRTTTDIDLVGVKDGTFVHGSGKAFIYTQPTLRLTHMPASICRVNGGCYIWEDRPYYG